MRAALALLLAAGICTAAESNWVGSWGCAPQLTEARNLPPAPGLANNTLRQIVHTSIGGKTLRLRFSNVFGTEAVAMKAVSLASSSGKGAIQPGTAKAIVFSRRDFRRSPFRPEHLSCRTSSITTWLL